MKLTMSNVSRATGASEELLTSVSRAIENEFIARADYKSEPVFIKIVDLPKFLESLRTLSS